MTSQLALALLFTASTD